MFNSLHFMILYTYAMVKTGEKFETSKNDAKTRTCANKKFHFTKTSFHIKRDPIPHS